MDENQQQASDAGAQDDWSNAEAGFLEDKGVKIEEKNTDEQAKSEEGKKDDSASKVDPQAKKSDEKSGDDNDSKKGSGEKEKVDPNDDPNLKQPDDPNAPYREARQVQRELDADRDATQKDIREKMFSDWSDDILDSDGDPLKTPADVMKRINPTTNKPFTEEEATAWLLAAQKQKDKDRAEVQARIEEYAETNIRIKDEGDAVRTKFGKILDKMPELGKEIWADFKNTLVIDEKSGVILKMPVSLQRFYERALQPYADYNARLEAEAAEKAKADIETKKQEKIQTKRTQGDREDIVSSGNSNVADPEEEGWAKAAKSYYEG